MYDLLGQYLKRNAAARIPMTFRDVETVIGKKLPASAYGRRPWWANEERGHSQAKAWLEAGYRAEQVDMVAAKLVFVRQNSLRGMAESRHEFVSAEGKMERHPMIGALKGTFTIDPEWDLTKPALDPEELEAMEANLDRTADMVAEGLRDKQS
jgi:hypothetical protein